LVQQSESQIRHLIEPLLEGYCQPDAAGLPSCKILQVNVLVDQETQASIAPGFDEVTTASATRLAPKLATVKLLMDSRIGPISRRKLVDIVEQYLSVLNYPVQVESKTASFPQPAASAGKVAGAKDKVIREFKESAEAILSEYCGTRCLLGEVLIEAEPVNAEELQYGSASDLIQQDGVAIRVGGVSATILMDESLPETERKSISDILKLKSSSFSNLSVMAKVLKFPTIPESGSRAGRSPASVGATSGISSGGQEMRSEMNSQSELNRQETHENSNSSNTRSENQNSSSSTSDSQSTSSKQESHSRIERIERVENGDAVQAELQKFKVFGIGFGAVVLALLVVIAVMSFRQTARSGSMPNLASLSLPVGVSPAPMGASAADSADSSSSDERAKLVAVRFECARLKEELQEVFASSPKVAKVVFSRILTEEGVETTAAYMQIFGESIVMDMLRDPSLQGDLNQLTEYYARNTLELSDQETLDLLRKLHHRTVSGKLIVMGSRASNLFDFLVEMDGLQIAELVRTETMTVKAIVATQCDPVKRGMMFQQLDEGARIELMAELSRIDYLPRDYVHNVAQALKRKRRDNPRLNTEALPGSEVLVGLLEKTAPEIQRSVMKSLGSSHPESVRAIKGKLVSVDTLRFLREGHMLEVLLSIKHDELLHFLSGVSAEIKAHIFAKAPKDLISEIEEELEGMGTVGRDVYQAVERKILNRVKLMAQEGTINLFETNERMFSENLTPPTPQGTAEGALGSGAALRRVA
jgi:flagellar motor switch protein FliG